MNQVWISRVTYSLLVELKTAAEHKAHFFEQLNIQLSRENRRLIERLLAKNNVPLVESPDNVIKDVLNSVGEEQIDEGMDLFEDEMGEPVIPRDANDEKRLKQGSDHLEMQP